MPALARIVKGWVISEAETVMAVAFLFSLLLSFGGMRERSTGLEFLRPILLGNIALSSLLVWPEIGISWRSFLFFLALGLGATEAGFWTGIGLSLMLPDAPAKKVGWSWRTDRWGCALTVAIAITFMIALGAAHDGCDGDL